MWISTITYDLVSVRATDPAEVISVFTGIQNKKDEIRAVDGNGNPVAGFEPKDLSDPSYQEESTAEIKRAWNTQSAAEEFVNFATSAADFVTGTVEEQV